MTGQAPASPDAAAPQGGNVSAAPLPSLPEALRKSVLAGMAEASPVMMAVYHLADLKMAYLNRAALDRLNPDGGADMSQRTLLDNIGVSSHQRFQAEIMPQACVRGGWSGECELRDVWGGAFTVLLTCTVVPAGRAHRGFFCVQAWEKSQAEPKDEARFSDRQFLHALLAHAPDSIYFKDTACRFLRMSRAQAHKFGLADPAEAIGRTDFDFFTSEHAAAAYANEQRILRTGEPIIDREEKETWGDGHITWVATSKLPLRDAAGKIIGTFGISRDITARKGLEETRREIELQLQLAQKMESIGRLAAGVAHEINTPTQFITDNAHFLAEAFAKYDALRLQLNALLAAAATHPDCAATVAQLMAAEKEAEIEYLSAEVPRCIQQSLDGLARVAKIVCSLKEFAHPNSPELAPADLNRTIETALVVSRHEWKFVAEVTTELDPALPLVPCVVDEFNQVILNLVINAAHAIGDVQPPNRGALGRITVRTRLGDPWAIVEIEDTGTGIPEEIREKIFEPFFTTKPVGKGTGQGLAIVRSVIEKHHHGRIEVRSEVGKGTTFVIHLPLRRSLVAAPTAPAAA